MKHEQFDALSATFHQVEDAKVDAKQLAFDLAVVFGKHGLVAVKDEARKDYVGCTIQRVEPVEVIQAWSLEGGWMVRVSALAKEKP